MKERSIKEMLRAKAQIERGEKAPGRVWEISKARKFEARDPKEYQAKQKSAWKQRVVEARKRLQLSQIEFARLLGVSVRTLHHWEQGTRAPSGAAGVLIRIAAEHPDVLLKASA